MNEKLKGQLRHALGAGAGYAIGKGWLDASDAGQIIEFIVLAAPFLWSWFSKRAASTNPEPAPPNPGAPANPS